MSIDRRRNQKFQSRYCVACNRSSGSLVSRGSHARGRRSRIEGDACWTRFLVNANPATMASVIAESSNSNGKTDTPLYKVPSRQTESAASTPIPAPASTPQENRDAPRQGSTQAPAPKTRNVRNRSSVASRFIDVKRRLIELWHQSLARSETRSWTAFSKLNSGVSRKAAAYTAATRN